MWAKGGSMLEALARNWGWFLVRAISAALYGVTLFLWPGLTLVGFVFVFGLYAVFDGVVALAIAIDVRTRVGFGSLLFEAADRGRDGSRLRIHQCAVPSRGRSR
jgi:uncharacterized membrane protein HdeD (DUF308 family)